MYVGVIACTLFTINLVMGVCVAITNIDHITLQMVHTIIGVTAYFIGILAEGTGYNTGFFHRNFYCIRAFRCVTALIFFLTAKDSLISFLLNMGVYWDSMFRGRKKWFTKIFLWWPYSEFNKKICKVFEKNCKYYFDFIWSHNEVLI